MEPPSASLNKSNLEELTLIPPTREEEDLLEIELVAGKGILWRHPTQQRINKDHQDLDKLFCCLSEGINAWGLNLI